MNLLELIQAFCEGAKLSVPTQVIASSDPQVVQIRRLLEISGQNIADRGDWQELNKEALWTTIASEDQGAISTLAPFGFKALLPQTLWDRSSLLPLLGPTSPQWWSFARAIPLQGPNYSFRLRGGHFITVPSPPAGHIWAFEYTSTFWISDALGSTFNSRFIADTDQALLRDNVLLLDLSWRWKKEKGLPYAEDYNDAERAIVNALGRSAGAGVLNTDGRVTGPVPGICIQRPIV